MLFRSGPRSAHIGGLPYAAFADPEVFVDARVELFRPKAGDPDDYVCIRVADGTRYAITNTCAANVLGYANTTWRPGTADGYPTVTTSNPALSYFGLATQITSAINMLEQNGDAWTLAEPKLSCRSGAESNFLAGGEIPIPVAQALGVVSVEYKQYGVKINFKPVADGNGNIDSKIGRAHV